MPLESGVNSVAAKSNKIEVNGKLWGYQRTFNLKHGVTDTVMSQIWVSGLTDTGMTQQEQYGGVLCSFSVVLLPLKNRSPVTLIVLVSAATLFTPETPKARKKERKKESSNLSESLTLGPGRLRCGYWAAAAAPQLWVCWCLCTTTWTQRTHVQHTIRLWEIIRNRLMFFFIVLRFGKFTRTMTETSPTGGGVKVQEAEADVRSLERTEGSNTEVKFTYTETPSHVSGNSQPLI